MDIVFATNNQNKVNEIIQMIDSEINIKGLADINCKKELPETHDTIEENSLEKAQFVFDNYGIDCFAEDTGLEIDALNGEPGVYSARYAGPQKDADDNMALVLEKMDGITNRNARFKTVISLIIEGAVHQFTGIAEGTITETRSGKGGFGYDPIFLPKGMSDTFAEISQEDKNLISHRGKAVKTLIEHLRLILA